MRDPASNPPPTRGAAPSSTSLLLDRLVDDGRELSHQERIQQLVDAALPDPRRRLSIEGEIARGGMGAVRVAFDATLQRRCLLYTSPSARD